MTQDEFNKIANRIRQLSPETADEFLLVYPGVLERLPDKAFKEWEAGALKLLYQKPDAPELCISYLKAGSLFLAEKSYYYLESWISQALKLARYSLSAAVTYFDLTPAFIRYSTFSHVREWGEKAIEVMIQSEPYDDITLLYLENSVGVLQYAAFREFLAWSVTAVNIARESHGSAAEFFKHTPKGIASLYPTERRKIYQLTSLIVRTMPDQALKFYRTSPQQLMGLNPNVREEILDTVIRNWTEPPENAPFFLDEIVTGLTGLSYPSQELVMKNEPRFGTREIGSQSIAVVRAYFKNAGMLLLKAHESFLPHWVDQGMAKLTKNEAEGVDYFSFTSPAAKAELARWKEAVFFDSVKNVLTLFTRGLCGKELLLLNSGSKAFDKEPRALQHPDTDDYTVYLPPFIAEYDDSQVNFLFYKIATAHQSGYIEFNTFDPRFSEIRAFLGALPHPETALDIFFILEDGRIDYNLRSEYPGLKIDLAKVLDRIFENRPLSCDHSPLQEALEAFLRLTVGHLDEQCLSRELEETIPQFKAALAGFFENAGTVWDSFLKSIEIYEIINPLLDQYAYQPLIPLGYRELSNLEVLSMDGVGTEPCDTLLKGDEEETCDPAPLSEEDIERLTELLKNTEAIEPLGKGESTGGVYLTDIDASVEKSGDDNNEQKISETPIANPAPLKSTEHRGPFYYDEWDYVQMDYRRKWCCLREITVPTVETGLFSAIQEEYSDLIKKVKEQFMRIRPEELTPLRRVDWGSELDFNAMIESVVDRKVGDTPSDRIFARREKQVRRISTLLLVDMSASTDRRAPGTPQTRGSVVSDPSRDFGTQGPDKRIIEIEMESLVVMTEALEALDDAYGIYGFSGYGRDQVEFYTIKDFHESCTENIKDRICNIQPRKSTRMGAAIRHATAKLQPLETDHQLLILLSDGYPQDMNYGEDRSSQDYALFDTRMALIEARNSGIRPFCITVDQCGDDYLRKMIDPTGYLIIQDIHTLPHVLPKVVESLIG